MLNNVVQWNVKNYKKRTISIDKKEFVCTTLTQPVTSITPVRPIRKSIKTSSKYFDNSNNNNNNNDNIKYNVSIGKCDKIKINNDNNNNINDKQTIVQSIFLVQTEQKKRRKRIKENSHSLLTNNVNFWRTKKSSQQPSVCDLIKILPVCFHISVLVFLWCINIDLATATLSKTTTTTKPIDKNLSSLVVSYIDDNDANRQSSFNDELTRADSDNFEGHYTHTWAVHIPNGEDNDLANTVARDHGFVNRGKIFDDHYHFAHHRMVKRSLSPALAHQSRLESDNRVFWAQQQKAKSRQKRDFVRMRSSRTSPRGLSLVDAMPFIDPKWPTMWYLNRGGGLDMNVIPAWKEGITGKGIVVTILDDGLESDHPDIKDNYDPLASYDVNSHDDDPMPHYDMMDSNRHGTRCAGEVAATANNSYCAVGIAFGASVGGVRMLDGDVTDAVEARSLSHNMHHVDIYSASWGPDDDGKTVDGPGELASRAFIEGVTKGRKGKGSIFIWASGNGGRELDNCNCDGYTNSIWTLSISSATEEGHVPWYSEKCSSTLATTYSSGGQGEKQVVTTDLHHTCTLSHTGTSASAPLAAGIAALVLESNPNLTWRDLQHIVVRTAKPANLKDPTWSRNGVGRRISHSFGYGLMDAAAMVRVARTWKTVPEQQRCEINAPHVDKVIPPKSFIRLQLTVKHCESVNFLEHVQAKVSLTTQRRGDIQLYLNSPAGTRVTLLTSRAHDSSRTGFNQWPFMSVHTWGESPHGNWQLEIHNEGKLMGHAFLRDWSLIFYGTTQAIDPNDPTSEPRRNSAEITTPNSSTTIGKSTTNLHQIYSPLYPRISTNNFGNSGFIAIGKTSGKVEANKAAYLPFGDVSSIGGNGKKIYAKPQNKQLAAIQDVTLAVSNTKNNNKNIDGHTNGKMCTQNMTECENVYKNNKGINGKSAGAGGKKDKTFKDTNSKNNNNYNNNNNSNKNKFYRKLQQQEQQQQQQQQQRQHQKQNNKLKNKSKMQFIEALNSYEDNTPVIGDLPLSYDTFLTANAKVKVPSMPKSKQINYGKLLAKATKHVSASPPALEQSSSSSSLIMATVVVGDANNNNNNNNNKNNNKNEQQIPKLFERYEKIQAIFPELQPYHHVPREKLTIDKRKKNNNQNNDNDRRKIEVMTSDNKNKTNGITKVVIGDILSVSKPLRDNTRKPSDSFMPDQRILKKQQLLLAAAGLSDTIQRPIALLSDEKNTNAQITQWDLVFYGTKAPAQSEDLLQGQNNPFGNEIEQNDIDSDTSAQWHNMQHMGESSVISSDITNASCIQTTTDQRCLACSASTFLFDGRCFMECPSHTFPMAQPLQQQQKQQEQEQLKVDLNSNTVSNAIEENEVSGPKENTNLLRACQLCDESCYTCYGPLSSQCSSCYPGSQMRKQAHSNENYCFVLSERSAGSVDTFSKTHRDGATVSNNLSSISGVAQLILFLVPSLIFSLLLVLLVAQRYLKPKAIKTPSTSALYKRNNYDRVSLFPYESDENNEEEQVFIAPNAEINDVLKNHKEEAEQEIPMHIDSDCDDI